MAAKELEPLEGVSRRETRAKDSNVVVVSELPSQQIRHYVGEDGTEYELKTIDEALTEVLTLVRKISQAVA